MLKEDNIIDLFIILIKEFFVLINEYIDVNRIENHTLFLITGINLLRNSFEYTLIKKKDLVNTKIYCERTIYYYLEYIKQLLEVHDTCYDINYSKVSIFINSKFLNNINSEEDELIVSLSNKQLIDKNINIKILIEDLNIFINNLYNWKINKKIMDYQNITDNNLNILKKHYKNINKINNYIYLLKERVEIIDTENTNLITSICKFIANNKKNHNEYLSIIKKFYINNDKLIDKYEKMNLNEFIYWLISYNNH
jgi:hypothetical protein